MMNVGSWLVNQDSPNESRLRIFCFRQPELVKGRKAPCLGVVALILFCVCERKDDGRERRTGPLPMPAPFPHPVPALSGHNGPSPSQQTNQALKFNSSLAAPLHPSD